jgi:hypothetical protein
MQNEGYSQDSLVSAVALTILSEGQNFNFAHCPMEDSLFSTRMIPGVEVILYREKKAVWRSREVG